MSDGSYEPVNVISVPPSTVPKRGLTAVSDGVNVPTYSIEFNSVSCSPVKSFAAQE